MTDQPRAHWAVIDTHNRPQVLETNSYGELPRVEALHLCGPFYTQREAANAMQQMLMKLTLAYMNAVATLTNDIREGRYGP